MDVNDIKKLIKHATLLWNKNEIAPIGLLETWRKKVEEKNLWDNESACSIDFISEKDGIPLLDGVWCKKFLLMKNRVIIAQDGTLYASYWDGGNQKFKLTLELQSFALEVILNVQMDSAKSDLYITTIKKKDDEENSFLCKQYQYDCSKEVVIRQWGRPDRLMNQETYKHNYLERGLNFNMNMIEYDKKNTPSAWLLSKIVTYGAAAIIVAILLGLGLKAYSKK